MTSMRSQAALAAVFSVAVIGNAIQAQEAAPAPAVKPPAAPPPALANTNAMAARQALYQEMRELSVKLRPAYEKLQNDEELKAAMDEVAKAQEKANQLRDAKLRTDPETAKLLDRMEAIRNALSPQRPRGKPGMMPPGGMKPMDRKPLPPAAPAPAASAVP
jgi:hypothetical protein